MPKDYRASLRVSCFICFYNTSINVYLFFYEQRQIFWIIKRLPNEDQLQLEQTFEAQRNHVTTTIIPAVMDALDKEIFSVSEGIVYEMIHNRHKHQREEYLNKQQSASHQDKQHRRKHMNSRRNDVSFIQFFFYYYTYFIIFYTYRNG